MIKGTIVRLVTDRGFGFIREDGGKKEYFFHRKDCAPDARFAELEVGEHMSFTPEEDTKGPRATDVTYA